jgi:superkiller protein 3
LKALMRAASISPDEWTCTFLMGMVHHQMGQYELAIAKFEQALASRPDEPAVLLSLADTFLSLGRLEFSTGFMTRSDASFASCISTCLRAIEAFPRFRRVAWKTAADALFELSKTEKFANQEAVREAVLALCNVLIYDGAGRPRERAVSGLGTYASIASRLEENVSGRAILWLAVVAYQFRVELCDGDADTHAPALFDLAVVLYSVTRKNPKGVQDVLLDQAAEALKLALKQEPSNELFWNALGTISFERNPKLAQHSYIRALELDSKVRLFDTTSCSCLLMWYIAECRNMDKPGTVLPTPR